MYKDMAQFTINKAENKRTERSPDYFGRVTVQEDIPAGTELKLSGWIRKGPNGSFISGAIAEHREQRAASEQREAGGQGERRMDAETPSEGDDVPF